MTVQETALFLGVSESTVRNWASSGRLQAAHSSLDGRRLFDPASLARLLGEMKLGSPLIEANPSVAGNVAKAPGELCGADEFLIVLDAEASVPRFLQRVFAKRAVVFSSGADLIRVCQTLQPFGVFVDINLGNGESGLDVLPSLRAAWPACPIIVVTRDDSEALIGRALALGADDFIAKPIRRGELTARFHARKVEIDLRNRQNVLNFGDVSLDTVSKTLIGPRGRRFPSPREVDLLTLLLRSPGLVIHKANLKGRIWGDIAVSDNAVDRKIFEIRRAIGDVSDTVEIRSLYGHGVELRNKLVPKRVWNSDI